MNNLGVNFLGVDFKNPIVTASGTFSVGREYGEFIDLNKLGGITAKGIANKPWLGNNSPRIAETYGGMLNAVGLQNDGAESFIEKDIPFLRQYDTNIIVNLCGHSIEEYTEVARIMKGSDVDLYELNISCPNVSAGGITFGTDEKVAFEVVSKVKAILDKPLVVKLTPNVTDITKIAKACESAGADGLSLINTLMGMKIDINKRKAILANKTGGMSGPAIKPVALNLVNRVHHAVNIPLIGMGGCTTWEDSVEFIMAGATLVAVGTANFINPFATVEIIDGLQQYVNDNNINDLSEIRGII